jgi:DNA polymerase II large subunit
MVGLEESGGSSSLLPQALPYTYHSYNEKLQKALAEQYAIAQEARRKGLDPTLTVESQVAFDLADRVAKLLDVPLAGRLRELLSKERTEAAALTAAVEVASGKYELPRGQRRAEAAVRIGLAIITDGVTVAPIQGVSAVRTKQNRNGSEYLSVEFAGPMRSAGGTESALTLVIADQVRKTLGLEKYNANSYDDEVGRFVEELRIYERDVGSFQYKVGDQDLRKAIENLPVEVDGVWTDNYEVVVHRNLRRISTNKVRGGALRVLNDGVIGKSKKLLKLLAELDIADWKWLSELSGGKQQGSDETKVSLSHFDEVISGRPVLSMPGRSGGFRLRYGRAPNTGVHAVGIHPSLMALLDYPIVVGTQIKVDMPGKAASIALVDTLEPPTVLLRDGSVMRVKDATQAGALARELESILYLGDILVAFGDFLENNHALVQSPYVEEWWALDLERALAARYFSTTAAAQELGIPAERLRAMVDAPLRETPSFEEALRLSRVAGVPLHPKYLLYWDQLSPQEILDLRNDIAIRAREGGAAEAELKLSASLKPLLERLGAEHRVLDSYTLVVTGIDAKVIAHSLGDAGERAVEGWSNSVELVSKLCGVAIRRKASPASMGVRVGRPEKAMPRKMRPPVQGLVPVGRTFGATMRDITLAAEKGGEGGVPIEIANSECPKCGERCTTALCQACQAEPAFYATCTQCGRRSSSANGGGDKCAACGGQLRLSSTTNYLLRAELRKAAARVDYSPQRPLKGVLGLTNELKLPERLEKALLRQKYDLSVYRDGTIRYDATNVPLTHFRPCQIQTVGVEKLRELGYARDARGKPLESPEQMLELFIQDIVIPFEAGAFFVSVAKYVDDLLVHHYGREPYYGIESPEQLIGHYVVGLAPHTSVGVIGRVLGYTNAQACFASPYWHSAKRRDCDGDGDSLMLLMDTLLNFSKRFLPSFIGGLMDAPLLIQPLVLPREVQRQAHHMDVSSRYPLALYEAAERRAAPAEVLGAVEIVKDRLDKPEQYANFGFTHDTDSITTKRDRASYSTLVTLTEKLDRQIELAQKIRAVSADEVVKSVLRTHLLPDIIGNTKAFTAQRFRCKGCGAKFRRMPVRGSCLACGGELQSNVTRGSVEKYLQLGLRLSAKYDVGGYLRSRFVLAAEELATLFKPEAQQTELGDFSSPSSSLFPYTAEPAVYNDDTTATAAAAAEPSAPLPPATRVNAESGSLAAAALRGGKETPGTLFGGGVVTPGDGHGTPDQDNKRRHRRTNHNGREEEQKKKNDSTADLQQATLF